VAASGAYLGSTFAVVDAQSIEFHPERLEDALVRRTVPAVEIATARDPAAGRALAAAQIGMVEPWLPNVLHGLLARWFVSDASLEARLASSQRAVRRFWEAGVPIVVGSDSGNWPIDPYHFHGVTTLRELELLRDAGMPPMEVLDAATRVPARMLDLSDEIGTVELGKRADLIVVRGDPLSDLRALRTIAWTIQGGVARTPEEWMDGEPVTRP
jgi:imidazolonepropionase-like amidohydrolase